MSAVSVADLGGSENLLGILSLHDRRQKGQKDNCDYFHGTSFL